MKKGGDEPFKFTSHLRYGVNDIIPYSEQINVLTSKGFAIWDVVKSCRRKGSLDSNIIQEEINDIRGLCRQHPSLKRIVFANGSTQCALFNKHFAEWWNSGELQPNSDELSQRAFGKKYARGMKKQNTQKHVPTTNSNNSNNAITCICAMGVSPAAAKFTYREKRDFWEQHVYQPGLEDYVQESFTTAAPKQE